MTATVSLTRLAALCGGFVIILLVFALPNPTPVSDLPGDEPALAVPTPVVATVNGAWNAIWHLVSSTFRSRTRMLQIATVGAIIGLFIMFRSGTGGK